MKRQPEKLVRLLASEYTYEGITFDWDDLRDYCDCMTSYELSIDEVSNLTARVENQIIQNNWLQETAA